MSGYQIEKLQISKVSINGVEVQKAYISMIEIFESLQQPGITGRIDLQDFQGIQELGNVIAGDELVLSFTVEGKENKPIESKFIIHSNEGNKIMPEHTYNTTVFGFCSPWLVPGLARKVSKHYTNKFVHEIIKDLLMECNAQIGFIEPTKQKLEIFVTPLWSPYHSIKHLLSFALNSEDKGGYLCWTDLKTGKVNITTLDYLLKGSLGKFNDFLINPANQSYEGRILNMTFETSFDLVRQMNAGIKHNHIAFNYDTGKHISIEDSHEELTYKHLSKKFPLPSSYTSDKKYIFPKFTSIFPQTKAAPTSEKNLKDLVSGIANTEHTFLSADVFKINIMTPGEPERRVGWLAQLNFPSQNINAGAGNGRDTEYKQLKGEYLIRDIRHMFSFLTDYKQAITLISDGYKEHERDLMNWSS